MRAHLTFLYRAAYRGHRVRRDHGPQRHASHPPSAAKTTKEEDAGWGLAALVLQGLFRPWNIIFPAICFSLCHLPTRTLREMKHNYLYLHLTHWTGSSRPAMSCCFRPGRKHLPKRHLSESHKRNKYLSTKMEHLSDHKRGRALRWSPDVGAEDVFIQHMGRPAIKEVCAKERKPPNEQRCIWRRWRVSAPTPTHQLSQSPQCHLGCYTLEMCHEMFIDCLSSSSRGLENILMWQMESCFVCQTLSQSTHVNRWWLLVNAVPPFSFSLQTTGFAHLKMLCLLYTRTERRLIWDFSLRVYNPIPWWEKLQTST